MSNARIIVRTANETSRTIKRNKDGMSMTFREQIAALETGSDFPEPFAIPLEDGQPPYPPGEYTLDLACLRVGDFKKLEIARLKLLPVKAAAPVRAAG